MCNDDTVNELKKDFHYTLSKFSHEIRNPLTLINSGLQMIASAHPEVEDYEHWDDVMDNLSYVRELLDELSAFNNAGRVKPEATDTGMYLKTVLSSVKPTLDYLDIRLVTDIPNDLPTLMLDRIQIRQMLLNLLKNAWEAVPVPGGQISVTAFTEKSGICINIQDNGCGISPQELENLKLELFKMRSRDVRMLMKEMKIGGLSIKNVYIRLYLTYGNHMLFDIQSNPNGTCITVGGNYENTCNGCGR